MSPMSIICVLLWSLIGLLMLLNEGFFFLSAVEPGRSKNGGGTILNRSSSDTTLSDIHDRIEDLMRSSDPAHTSTKIKPRAAHAEVRSGNAKFLCDCDLRDDPGEYADQFLEDFSTEVKENAFIEFARSRERKRGPKQAQSGMRPPQSPWRPGFRKPQRNCCGASAHMGDCCTGATMCEGSAEAGVGDEIRDEIADEAELDGIQDAASISVGVKERVELSPKAFAFEKGYAMADWIGVKPPQKPTKGDKLMSDIATAKERCHSLLGRHCVIPVEDKLIGLCRPQLWEPLQNDAISSFGKPSANRFSGPEVDRLWPSLSTAYYRCAGKLVLLKNRVTASKRALGRKKTIEAMEQDYMDDIDDNKKHIQHDFSRSSNDVAAQYKSFEVRFKKSIKDAMDKDEAEVDKINEHYWEKLQQIKKVLTIGVPLYWESHMEQDWLEKEHKFLQAQEADKRKKRQHLDVTTGLPDGLAEQNDNFISTHYAELVVKTAAFRALQEESEKHLTTTDHMTFLPEEDLISKDHHLAWKNVTWEKWIKLYKEKDATWESYIHQHKSFVPMVCLSVALVFFCGMLCRCFWIIQKPPPDNISSLFEGLNTVCTCLMSGIFAAISYRICTVADDMNEYLKEKLQNLNYYVENMFKFVLFGCAFLAAIVVLTRVGNINDTTADSEWVLISYLLIWLIASIVMLLLSLGFYVGTGGRVFSFYSNWRHWLNNTIQENSEGR